MSVMIVPVDEMYHSGVKGMKWYSHRWWNEDGTLTEAGKIRYRKLSDKHSETSAKVHDYQAKADKYAAASKKLDRKLEKNAAKIDRGKAEIDNEWENKQLKKYYKLEMKSLEFQQKAARGKYKLAKLQQKMYKLVPPEDKESLKHGDTATDFFKMLEEMSEDQRNVVYALFDDILPDDEVEHSGVKGQKWYSNRWWTHDKKLTPAGREHYGYGQADEDSDVDKSEHKHSTAGMHWSKTKNRDPYQKADGTLTRRGREHFKISEDRENAGPTDKVNTTTPATPAEVEAIDKQAESIKVSMRQAKKKRKAERKAEKIDNILSRAEARSISDDELNARINRLNKEKLYDTLLEERKAREMSSSKKLAVKVFTEFSQKLASRSVDMMVDKIVKKASKAGEKPIDLSKYKDKDIYKLKSDEIEKVSQAFQQAAQLAMNRYKIEHPGGKDKNKGN